MDTGTAPDGKFLQELRRMQPVLVYGTVQTGMEVFAIPGTAPDGPRIRELVRMIIIALEDGTVQTVRTEFAKHGTALNGMIRQVMIGIAIVPTGGIVLHGVMVAVTNGTVWV